MPGRIITFIRSEINAIRNGKVVIFLACLVLATLLWFLNALEKPYTDHIYVPVNYINLPKNKELTGYLPHKLDLTVDALGYTLLRYKLRIALPPLLIDVNELSNNYLEANYSSKYSISTNGHKEELAKQINSELKIISIRPDSLTFKVSHVIEKMIHVTPTIKATFAREYILQKPPTSKPESILISGPEEIIDTIKELNTKQIEFNNLSQSLIRDVDLILPEEVHSKISKVTVQITVEQSTEAKFEIPIEIVNQPKDILIKSFPSRVKITCRVGVSQFNKLNKESFKAFINFSDHNELLTKLPVKLNNLPENILSMDYYPKEVDYIIEHK
jgi:YbbR domain-containing protein